MYIIHPDGKVESVKYNGSLDEIYKAIRAPLFDIVHIGKGLDLFLDDEGLYRSENFRNRHPWWNLKATHLRTKEWLRMGEEIDWSLASDMPPLCGWACVLAHDGEGNTIDLTAEQEQYIKDELNIK